MYVPSIYRLGPKRNLVWVDREGKEELLDADARHYVDARISPDGARVAVEILEASNNDVWVYDLTRNTLDRVTFDLARDSFPQWSPDGQSIAFSSAREGVRNVFWKKADGTGSVQRLTASTDPTVRFSFSPDQKTLVFVSGPGIEADIHILSLEDGSIAEALIATTAQERMPEISPDGKWIAYTSNESGRRQVYVRPFPNVDDGRWLISSEAGVGPVWSRDGHELFYFDTDIKMMVVSVQTEPSFSHGNPQVLFESQYLPVSSYDISPDGQRFLMINPTGLQEEKGGLTLVQNWFEELKRLVPTN